MIRLFSPVPKERPKGGFRPRKDNRHFILMTEASVADPAHQIRLVETSTQMKNGEKVVNQILWTDTWRTRLIGWLIERLLRPRGVWNVARAK